MLQIEQIKLRVEEPEALLRKKAAAALRVSPDQIQHLTILRRSVDAREGLHFVYTLRVACKNEGQVLKKCRSKAVSPVKEKPYTLPAPVEKDHLPPVIVGAGPGGLFCALAMVRCGVKPILLERGKAVEDRQKDVERFWQTGELDTQSNVQYGEGGAGAFSDGKLNTGTKDLRHRFILETLVSHGAPETILCDAKPHVGTDYLHRSLISLRRELLERGADIRFGHRMTGMTLEHGAVTGLTVESPEGGYTLPARHIVLALGNSARDTFEMLHGLGVPMEPKPLAIGVRIEHSQHKMDVTQYKDLAGHPRLGAATYKLSCHLDSGRSVFSFCVCPGGQVVAAASEERRAVTNGMSYYARAGENINGGLLVSVKPEDFPGTDPLAGIRLQRELEERAFTHGGGGFIAPAQRLEDFLAHRPSAGPGSILPTYRPGVHWCDLWKVLPDYICESLEEALPMLERKLPGFADPDAVLTAVETRSSCPLRILRGEDLQSPVGGLWPCGEGAGYAGGIMSAAADGIRVAEQVMDKLR